MWSTLLAIAIASGSIPDAPPIRVELEPCEAGRLPLVRGFASLARMMAGKEDRLDRRGRVKVDDETFTIYLPAAEHYRLDAGTASAGSAEDPATVVSVDADGSNTLETSESWFSSLPIRIGDRMFELASIAEDRSHLVLQEADVPLRGLVLGRIAPEFSLRTVDGRRMTRDDYRGKALILDFWSVT